MAGHVSLLSRGRPPSLAKTPPKRLRSPCHAQCTTPKQRSGHDPSMSSEAFPPSFPAFSPPFTPFTPRFAGTDIASSPRKTDPPRSVVHEYIRRGIYTSKKHAPTEPGTSRTLTSTREEKVHASPSAVKREHVSDSAFPPVRTAGERRHGARWQQNEFDRKSSPRRIHTQGTKGGSGTSATVRPPAHTIPPKSDTADIDRIRSCILYNQRKLTELTAQLKRIADPYTVKESLAETGQHPVPHPHLGREQSAKSTKNTRFPSAPASSRRHADKDARVVNTHHDVTSKVAIPWAASARRSQEVAPSAALQQDSSTAERGKADRIFCSRSASTPASFSRLHGHFKSRPLEPAIILPATTPKDAIKRMHLNKGGKDLSKTLVKKEPLSAKEVRKLVFAWKSADQQLEEKMNFWVRELPTEVRNRVRAAAGVETKFLALRDCVSSLWRASEERALAVLKMHQTVADFKQCYQSGQGQLQSALIGVQGGLLAASTKIKQIDRLIRLQPDARSNEERADYYCMTSDAGYPFTPYTSVYYTPTTRAQTTADTNREKCRVTTSESEPSTNAETPEKERNRKDNNCCLSGGTNETDGATAAASSIPSLRRTRGMNNSPAEDVTHEAAPPGSHAFVTRNCVPAKNLPYDDAGIPSPPGAAQPLEYGTAVNTNIEQYNASGANAGLMSAATVTPPPAASAPECRGGAGTRGTIQESESPNATPSPVECTTDKCSPASLYSIRMRQVPADAAKNAHSLTVKTPESPYACDEGGSDGEIKHFHYCAAAPRRTSKRDISSMWRRAADSILGHSSFCLGPVQKYQSENPLGSLTSLSSVDGLEFDTCLPSSDLLRATQRRGERGIRSSPRFPPSSSSYSSSFPLSATVRGSDAKKKTFNLPPDQEAASCFTHRFIPVEPGKLDKQAKNANLRTTGIHNNEPEDSHAEEPDDRRRYLPTAVLHSVQESWQNDLLERRRMSSEIPQQPDFYSLTAQQHENLDGQAVKDPPSNSPHNEDVSWAADLVSRWRAQRR